MTDGKPRPEEEPAPPTSTRWSRDAAETDEEPAPPFIPGSAGPGPEPREPHPAEAEPFPFEGGGSADEDGTDEMPAGEAEDDFPFEAFDIGGTEHEADAGTAPPADEPVAETTGPGAAMPSPGPEAGFAAELADRLEEMAHRLRIEGPEAAEAEMSSSDRFTALLAGLLAGYLAGRT